MDLDDNTRSALHYLALGAVVLMALLLLDRLISGAAEASNQAFPALAPFQHGFLLGEGAHIVDTESSRGERVAWALVTAVVLASFSGLLASLVFRWGARSSILLVRAVLVATLAWCLYAALFVPTRWFFVRDGMLVEWRHARSIGDLPVPLTRTISLHRGAVEVQRVADGFAACGAQVSLVLEGEELVKLASLRPRSNHCADDLTEADANARAAAATLNGLLDEK